MKLFKKRFRKSNYRKSMYGFECEEHPYIVNEEWEKRRKKVMKRWKKFNRRFRNI